MTLERYFKINGKKNIIDFSLRAQVAGGIVTFYIHPDSKDGETLDFYVFGNDLIPKEFLDNAKLKCAENLVKRMNEIKIQKIFGSKDAQKQHNGK
ncbi:MAG: hypothetical protein IMZ53_05890 [Thermoplasmata archaeon]|nr:hypothetical protein [Thermoplasmata archaeon]